MIRRSASRALALIALLALGAFAWFFLTERPIAVPVVSAEQNVRARVYGLGTVEARIVSNVGFEVGAALVELAVDSGDTVTTGEVLARLHQTEQEAKVARTEAAVEAATAIIGKAEAGAARAQAIVAQREAANARQQELFKRRAISAQIAEDAQRDIDIAVADLAVAKSEVDVVRAQLADAAAALKYEEVLLDHHVLTAPFDGVVVKRHAEAGTVVRAGEVIFTLMDPETVRVLAYVDEERAGAVAVGQKAEIRIRSLPHNVFTGTVTRIDIESDRVNEERRVWIACDQCPVQVYLGEQAEVWITVAEIETALLVPEAAISGFDGHQGHVWVVEEGRAQQAPLVFGYRTEDARVEVVSGLPEGAKIISRPVKGLSEDRMVRVISEDTP
ncbi:MAG: efflux transporter periplasmic adaptor subunit [Ahrensia sp.]|nr:efflux transporter periplasmic adaptor subunit [Ahrensia sp.]